MNGHFARLSLSIMSVSVLLLASRSMSFFAMWSMGRSESNSRRKKQGIVADVLRSENGKRNSLKKKSAINKICRLAFLSGIFFRSNQHLWRMFSFVCRFRNACVLFCLFCSHNQSKSRKCDLKNIPTVTVSGTTRSKIFQQFSLPKHPNFRETAHCFDWVTYLFNWASIVLRISFSWKLEVTFCPTDYVMNFCRNTEAFNQQNLDSQWRWMFFASCQSIYQLQEQKSADVALFLFVLLLL